MDVAVSNCGMVGALDALTGEMMSGVVTWVMLLLIIVFGFGLACPTIHWTGSLEMMEGDAHLVILTSQLLQAPETTGPWKVEYDIKYQIPIGLAGVPTYLTLFWYLNGTWHTYLHHQNYHEFTPIKPAPH